MCGKEYFLKETLIANGNLPCLARSIDVKREWGEKKIIDINGR